MITENNILLKKCFSKPFSSPDQGRVQLRRRLAGDAFISQQAPAGATERAPGVYY